MGEILAIVIHFRTRIGLGDPDPSNEGPGHDGTDRPGWRLAEKLSLATGSKWWPALARQCYDAIPQICENSQV